MTTSTRDNTKPGKRPPETGTLVGVRVQSEMLAALDQARAAMQEPATRPEAIRRALADWLRERGYLA